MILKRGLSLAAALVLALVMLGGFLPGAAKAEDLTYFSEESNAQLDPSRWGNAADRIDRLADSAFQAYLAGEAGKAYGYVSDSYFQVYEITGFERNTMNYVSGPRKNAVELQFSTCKAAVKKENETTDTRISVRSALAKLKAMIREDGNKLAAQAGDPQTETSWWLDGNRVAEDPWGELAGDPNAKVHYATWGAASEAMDELFYTQRSVALAGQVSGLLDAAGTVERDLNVTVDNAGVVQELRSLRGEMAEMTERMARLQVVLDSGTLVGELAEPMDQALGQRISYRERGI